MGSNGSRTKAEQPESPATSKSESVIHNRNDIFITSGFLNGLRQHSPPDQWNTKGDAATAQSSENNRDSIRAESSSSWGSTGETSSSTVVPAGPPFRFPRHYYGDEADNIDDNDDDGNGQAHNQRILQHSPRATGASRQEEHEVNVVDSLQQDISSSLKPRDVVKEVITAFDETLCRPRRLFGPCRPGNDFQGGSHGSADHSVGLIHTEDLKVIKDRFTAAVETQYAHKALDRLHGELDIVEKKMKQVDFDIDNTLSQVQSSREAFDRFPQGQPNQLGSSASGWQLAYCRSQHDVMLRCLKPYSDAKECDRRAKAASQAAIDAGLTGAVTSEDYQMIDQSTGRRCDDFEHLSPEEASKAKHFYEGNGVLLCRDPISLFCSCVKVHAADLKAANSNSGIPARAGGPVKTS